MDGYVNQRKSQKRSAIISKTTYVPLKKEELQCLRCLTRSTCEEDKDHEAVWYRYFLANVTMYPAPFSRWQTSDGLHSYPGATTPSTAPALEESSPWASVLSAWGSTAGLAARFLGKSTGRDDDVATDIFFSELASRVGGLAGFLDLMYQQHPRLRAFLIGLLLGVVALLGAAVPLALVACFTGGRVPLPWRPATPRCCLACCVLLGLIALFALADLTAMMALQAVLVDAVQLLPAAFQGVTDGLRQYANRTVIDLLAELEDADVTVSEGVRNFLYQVLQNETVGRISALSCLTASSAADSTATKVRRCKNVPARMLLQGAAVPSAGDLIRDDLHLQLNRTLASIDRLEIAIAAFEQRTELWSRATIIDLVATPVVMILLCITVALLGVGIASGIRSCVIRRGERVRPSRRITVIMLANGALIMLFLTLATPVLMVTSSTGTLGECYVCAPYRQSTFSRPNALARMAWPTADRGALFSPLAPELVLTECASHGASIAALHISAASTASKATPTVDAGPKRSSAPDSSSWSAGRHPMGGNCRPLFDILTKALKSFCDEFLQSHISIALALAVAIALLVGALPLVLVVSQFFHAAREDVTAEGDGRKTRASTSKQRETSCEELFAEDGSIWFSSRRTGSSVDTQLKNRGHRSRRPRSCCLPIVGKPRRPRHDKRNREGVQLFCGGKSSSVDDSSSLISTEQATATEAGGLPRRDPSTPRLVSACSQGSLVSCKSQTRLDSGDYNAATLSRRCPSSDLINEYYPIFPFSDQHVRRFRSRFAWMGKPSRKTSLGTIPEEPEPSESELSMLTALSTFSDERNSTRNTTPSSDKGGEDDQFVSADAFQFSSSK
ncbi:hypothetical protein HPB50_014786 [Hyalomma asiaticum]|uniref:Uncharacterized protein n=1 Tax=Hyalomma asiaticum TaxID=266040 RepID=A0ACB7SI01_HYAAI|nr:hypothetical protein HPB50_014786 [Hyalomma asiaticum]